MPAQAPVYRFGSFELRPRTRELYKAGTKLRLRPQPFQVLHALVERAGDVVTREELRESLWSKETFVDFEHGLNTSIKELRGVLSDSANKPRYIETLPKLGYRFIAAVEVDAPAEEEAEAPPQAKAGENRAGERSTPERFPWVTRARRWPIAIGVGLVLVAALGTYFQWSRSRVGAQQTGGRLMLAVLPFENLTGDAGQEYFSDGLTEEMISQLGNLDPQHLGVIGRTSVMHYKHTQESLQQIGRELGVQYVLEGSVRRDSDKVRISAQLIQMKDQTHVWARQYDRELGGILALQGEIAREAADEIQLTLGSGHKVLASDRKPAASPNSYEAYDLYLKGRYFWNKRTPEGFQQAAEYFQQAIVKDPNYAPAYAGLADTFALMSSWFLAPQNEFMPKARAAALKALQIDETLAEAHTSLALIAENHDYDWQTAEKEYQQAIELNPNYATAHHWYAECLMWEGRFGEALGESERARQLDPLSLIIATDHGAILYYSRQYDRAIAQSRAVLDMDPSFGRAEGILLGAYVQEGRFAEALDYIEQHHPLADNPWTWVARAEVYGPWGRTAEAQHALAIAEQLLRSSPSEARAPLPPVYVAVGRKDQAIALLQKAYAEHSSALVGIKVDPSYDPLRSDPRFQDLLRRVGLAQ
jgi:TolB-like protein/DNA-binding winged helix-turn-helix (wHTH) protein/Flp pilus assembly protein TadD